MPVITLPLACSRDRRALTTQPSAVGPGGVGHGSEYDPGRAPSRCGCRRPELVVIGVEHVDVRVGREVGSERHAEQPTVPEVVHVDVQVRKDVRRWCRSVSRRP